ncbi:hypothetical protein K4F52_002834 [Lecanicillium sp. MT-2017a]|nr:hypothetical protein K4F52_002834 [Lecanicillium sp. MT-2017a]
MLISLTVGKVDAGVTVLLTPDKRLIEFPSILLPPNISSGSIVDINVSQNTAKESTEETKFRALQERIFSSFGASEPATPVLRCRNATQTSVVLEWDPVELATADLVSLSLYRNGQKAGNIPRPLQMHSTKISGLAVDTEYTFHLVLRTSAGTRMSEKVAVRTHKMTDLSGITITPGFLPSAARESLGQAVERIGAKIVDGVRIDTTHFVTTEGRGTAWEKAVENNIPVVRPEWVDACEKNGRILGVTKFYLDAMRPGPPSEGAGSTSTPPPPVPAKDEAPAAAEPSEDNKAQQEDKGGDDEDEKDEEQEQAARPSQEKKEPDNEDDAEEEERAGEEAEQKARRSHQEEQKMRLEDKEDQKVALRPKQADEADKQADTEEKDGDEQPGKADGAKTHDDDKDKPSSAADGESFQDVQL